MREVLPEIRSKYKSSDPQLTVEGELKHGEYTDLIVFTIPLVFFEIVCIVNIPLEGETRAPVYCKFKVNPRGAPFVLASAPRRVDVSQRQKADDDGCDSAGIETR
jgi:hypothetical protein